MSTSQHISRRSMLAGAAATGAAMASRWSRPASAAECSSNEVKTYTNADFYDADGNFLIEKARAAYYDMFDRFHYPISETIKKEMWILDFHLGDFVEVGMAGIFWLNRQDYGYFGHEIYLLPGQMIPEHCHVATDKGPAKMESWQPRRGMVYTFGEGEATARYLEKIPRSQRELVHARCGNPLQVDEIGHLSKLETWHYMVAGPEGALVTEYGTFHDMDGLKLSNPKARL